MATKVYLAPGAQQNMRQFIADYHISIIPKMGNLNDEHKEINNVLDGIFQKIQKCSNTGEFTIEVESSEFKTIRRAMYLSRDHQHKYIADFIDYILTEYDNRNDRQ